MFLSGSRFPSGGPRVGIAADDLSGSADCAVAFAGWDDVAVALSAEDAKSADARVLAIDADSRWRSPAEAAARTRGVVGALLTWNPDILIKKTDSTLRGHVGVETAAALSCLEPASPRPFALVVPAFPSMGRTTVGGRQLVDGVPVSETPYRETLTMRTGGDIRAILAREGIESRGIGLQAIRTGTVADLLRALERVAADSIHAVVCDAAVDDDLDRLVRAARGLRRRVMYVGSAGLAHAIARAEGHPGDATSPLHLPGGCGTGPMLVLVASRAEATRKQVDVLARQPGVERMDIPTYELLGGAPIAAERVKTARAFLRAGRDLVLGIGEYAASASRDVDYARALAAIAVPIAPIAAMAVATGGDMARCLLQTMGVSRVTVLGETERGVVVSRWSGSKSGLLATKAGGFGDAGTLVRVRTWLGRGVAADC